MANLMQQPHRKSDDSLASWVDAIPSTGRYGFTREEGLGALGMSRGAFNRAAGRLAARKRVARVRGSFYVVVPLEHLAAGMIPAEWFVVDLMKALGRPFYIGGLTAAEYHGAAHQKSQWFHVVTDQPVRDIICRGVGLRFFAKEGISSTPALSIKGVTGYLPVSSPEATAVDLVRYARRLGGLNHVLTVLQELGERLNARKLVEAVRLDGHVAYGQRLGWLLERAGHSGKTGPLAKWVAAARPFDAKLEPSLPVRGGVRAARWLLRINADVEGDLP
ncbi:MAG TPA: type IV toxin-antitoxin system AbiEi family antitoxin [Kiritimatiellia bacterium]|mgnify:CR=1 FL=1|nr:type IV toxin-antitoxin system AbiEi family antitoxin [Kiritimatiellia bacterium]